ncbi:MAG: hypothetical protein WCP45_15220, partial [Verrucomicrobiota bacterium]
MQIRNITFGEANGQESLVTMEQETTSERLRLRSVAVSPHEEYLLREGSVRPISNELHAAILSRKGRVTITAKGVVVDRVDMGGANVYWHEDSILCNDLSARERKIFYVINPLQQDVVHLLKDDGTYIESLPRRIKPEVLNVEQQAAEMRKQQAFSSRAASRLQEIHGADTASRLADLQANSVEMQRVVQTLPAPAAAPRQAPSPATGAGRQASDRVRELAAFRAMRESALDLGRAVSISHHDRTQVAAANAEDWSPAAADFRRSPADPE